MNCRMVATIDTPQVEWMGRPFYNALTPSHHGCRIGRVSGDDTFGSLVARIAHSASLHHRSGRAARQTSAVLIKDRPQIHFQRRVCALENSASELAETFGFG